MTTAYVTHDRSPEHDLPGHPEHAGRLSAIESLLATTGVTDRLLCLKSEPASEDQLLRVHTSLYIGLLASLSLNGRGLMFGSDTYALPTSYEVARLAAGAALRAVDAVVTGEARNALVAARPPGHHALPDMAMGFCLLANVSLAARHAQAAHGVERILIVDYDVHHGNGTQAIFYQDPDVLYISTHQWPWYPGTGDLAEIGEGDGRGATINVPLSAGYGDETFAQVYEQVVWPAARRFQPELMLISAGFDAHWDDPLGRMTLTLSGYRHLTDMLVRMAGELCQGRVVFILEGGYSLPALPHAVLNIAYALLEEGTVSDPLGLPESAARQRDRLPPIDRLLAQVRDIHHLA